MKMRAKKLCVLLLAVAVIITCAGCSKIPRGFYDIKPYIYALFGDGNYEVGISHNGFLEESVGIAPKDAYTLVQGGAFTLESAPPEASISFFGRTLSGKYTESKYYDGSSLVTHFYEGQEEGQADCTFGIQEQTGEILYVSIPFAKPLSDTVLLDAELQRIAEECASQYIETEDYSLAVSKSDADVFHKCKTIRYEYTRPLHGRETSEHLRISLLPDGSVYFLERIDLGAYDTTYDKELAVLGDWTIEELAALTTAEEPNLEIKKIENVKYKITPWGDIVLLADIHYENSGIRSDKNHTAKRMAFLVEWKTPGAVSAMLIFVSTVAVIGGGACLLIWIRKKKKRIPN